VDRNQELDRRGQEAVQKASAALARSPRAVSGALEALGHALVPAGLAGMADAPRLPRLVARMRAASQAIATWEGSNTDPTNAALAEAVSGAMALTATHADRLLRAVHGVTADMFGLLRGWMANPVEAANRIERVEWVLDGWDYLVLLWETNLLPTGQRAAMLEMAQILPPTPRELSVWLNLPDEPGRLAPSAKVTSLNDGWRNGSAAYALISRNERLRALSV
jgi:hypothetical protein